MQLRKFGYLAGALGAIAAMAVPAYASAKPVASQVKVGGGTTLKIDTTLTLPGEFPYTGKVTFEKVTATKPTNSKVPGAMKDKARTACKDLFTKRHQGVFPHVEIFDINGQSKWSPPDERPQPDPDTVRLSYVVPTFPKGSDPDEYWDVFGSGKWRRAGDTGYAHAGLDAGDNIAAVAGFWTDEEYIDTYGHKKAHFSYKHKRKTASCDANFQKVVKYPAP